MFTFKILWFTSEMFKYVSRRKNVSGLSEANDSDLPHNSSLRWRVVLSARAQIQMDQSELRVKLPCERPLPPAHTRASRRKAEKANFKANFRYSRVFRPPKYRYLEWNLLGFLELLFLLRYGTFLFEEKAICGVTSGQRWMKWSAFSLF